MNPLEISPVTEGGAARWDPHTLPDDYEGDVVVRLAADDFRECVRRWNAFETHIAPVPNVVDRDGYPVTLGDALRNATGSVYGYVTGCRQRGARWEILVRIKSPPRGCPALRWIDQSDVAMTFARCDRGAEHE